MCLGTTTNSARAKAQSLHNDFDFLDFPHYFFSPSPQTPIFTTWQSVGGGIKIRPSSPMRLNDMRANYDPSSFISIRQTEKSFSLWLLSLRCPQSTSKYPRSRDFMTWLKWLSHLRTFFCSMTLLLIPDANALFSPFKSLDPTVVCEKDCGATGICSEAGTCECLAGWSGDNCEMLTCDPRCAEHGQCKNGTCICSVGWNGKHCTLGKLTFSFFCYYTTPLLHSCSEMEIPNQLHMTQLLSAQGRLLCIGFTSKASMFNPFLSPGMVEQ